MAKIPPQVALSDNLLYLLRKGVPLYGQGKVRDTFDLGDILLVSHSDRLSIFDFVLPVLVPGKGVALAKLSRFWFRMFADIPNHLVDDETDRHMRSLVGVDFQRCLVVKKRRVQPFELIFRHHIGGSVWNAYLKTGIVAGQRLPQGLKKWQRLDQPMFTPSTKDPEGHDENITQQEYYEQIGMIAEASVKRFRQAYKRAYIHAQQCGFLILDTKGEMEDALDPLILDEIFTPDSSRYTTKEDLELALAEGRDPIFWDKEVARIWGRTVKTPFVYSAEDEKKDPKNPIKKKGMDIIGINNLDPKNPLHVAFVHNLVVPEEIPIKISANYRELVYRITGSSLYEGK